MQTDTLIKLLDRFFRLFNFKQIEENPPFETPEKVLLIMPEFIGDSVLLTPFIRNLKMNLCYDGYIDIVCNKPIAELLKTLPYVRRIYINTQIKKLRHEFLLRKNYDTMFIFNYSIRWSTAAKYASISQIISPDLKRLGMTRPPIIQKVVTHTVSTTHIKDKTPQLKVNLDYLEELGMEVYDYHPEIILTDKDINNALRFVKTDKPKAYINITAGSPGKEWGIQGWIEVIKFLQAQNFEIFSSGTLKEMDQYNHLENESGVCINNLCGKTTVRESIALLKYMDIALTTDSAPAHFAAVAKTPKIAVLYGPTNHYQWKPFTPFSDLEQIYLNLPCRPCLLRGCTNKKCIKNLSHDFVINKISNLLTRKPISMKVL